MENFTLKDASFIFAWFIIWVALGALSLYAHNLVLPYVFLALALATYAAHLRLACTRCRMYGRLCCLFGGLLSPRIFKQRAEGPSEPDDPILEALWLVTGVFPLPFLLYYHDWPLILMYSTATCGWFLYRKYLVCKNCGNEWCGKKK